MWDGLTRFLKRTEVSESDGNTNSVVTSSSSSSRTERTAQKITSISWPILPVTSAYNEINLDDLSVNTQSSRRPTSIIHSLPAHTINHHYSSSILPSQDTDTRSIPSNDTIASNGKIPTITKKSNRSYSSSSRPKRKVQQITNISWPISPIRCTYNGINLDDLSVDLQSSRKPTRIIHSLPEHTINHHYSSSILPSQDIDVLSIPSSDTIASNGKIPTITMLRDAVSVNVLKSGKFYDSADCKVPTYKTSSEKRGIMLLINNIKFADGNEVRKGAELDETNMKELFKQMGFDVETSQNLNKKNMTAKIKRFRNDKSLKSVDIGVVVVMSHGTGTSLSDSTEVQCVDGQTLHTQWIIDQFDSQKCPSLANKPKIFIFQCCRGSDKDVEFDATPIPKSQPGSARITSDMLIAYSTVPGFVAHRNPLTGSWYIQAICRVFMDYAHDTDVESMLKMVDHALSTLTSSSRTRQTASFENRGFKTCYLHPK